MLPHAATRESFGQATETRPKTDLSVCSQLPTLPQVAVEILDTFNSIDTPIESIVRIIERDPAVASKIMRAANSALYSPKSRIAELRRAVLMLGKRAVTPLVLSFCLAPESMKDDRLAEHYQMYWLTALIRSLGARLIAEPVEPGLSGDASTVALLSNLGRLSLLRHHKELAMECLDLAHEMDRAEVDVERERLGFSHIDLSVEIMIHLRFAHRGIRAIRLQHEDVPGIVRQVPAAERSLCHVIAASRCLSDYVFGHDPAVAYVQLGEHLQAINHPGSGNPAAIVSVVRDEFKSVRTLFEVDGSNFPDPMTLLQRSLDQLAQFSLMLHADICHKEVPQQLLEENGKLKRRVADLIIQATVDPLTGVYNRSQLEHLRDEMFALGAVRSQPVGILVVDVDLFKQINDRFGHVTGDNVLKAVATTLAGSVRECDVVGRYGGEEFVMIISDASAEALRVISERARQAVEKMVFKDESQSFSVTVSIGGSFGFPDQSPGMAEKVFAVADEALYRAKRAGRNRSVIEQFVDS
jgi:diguanylate cyclase (GGDEF)-like protein